MQATIKPATQKVIIRLILEAAQRVNVDRKTRKLETTLEAKLKRLFIQHGNAFLKGLAKHKSSFKESIPDDTIDELFDNTSPNANMATAIQSAVESAISVGADTLIDQLDVDTVFSLENPRAVEYLDNYGAELVKGLDETSKRILRDLLANATEQGFSYQKTAKLIEKLFTDWSTNRAKLIATTEIGNAYQEGNLIVGKDLAASGVAIEKSWLTRGDDKVDPHCSANADQGWIDVNAVFSSGVERPLDHPRCRCVMLMRRKPDVQKITSIKQPIKNKEPKVKPIPTPKPAIPVAATKPAAFKIPRLDEIATSFTLGNNKSAANVNKALGILFGDTTSNWNGKLLVENIPSYGRYVFSTGAVSLNKGFINQLRYKDVMFQTTVHELIHTRSKGPKDLKNHGIGWEEAIVERNSQIHFQRIADAVGYTPTGLTALKSQWKKDIYTRLYINPLSAVVKDIGLNETQYYTEMLNKTCAERQMYIREKLIEKYGQSAGTSKFNELDKELRANYK
jgi:hypothetical protein